MTEEMRLEGEVCNLFNQTIYVLNPDGGIKSRFLPEGKYELSADERCLEGDHIGSVNNFLPLFTPVKTVSDEEREHVMEGQPAWLPLRLHPRTIFIVPRSACVFAIVSQMIDPGRLIYPCGIITNTTANGRTTAERGIGELVGFHGFVPALALAGYGLPP